MEQALSNFDDTMFIAMFIVNIVIAISTTAAAIMAIIQKITAHKEKIELYAQAVREGYAYDSSIKTLADMCSMFILRSITRHNDGQSYEYGFHKVVREHHIINRKDFLEFVIRNQRKNGDTWSFDEVQCLLKLK